MKSILTHFGDDSGFETRLQAALDIVRATKGHLTGIFATPFANIPVVDPFAGFYVSQSLIDAVYQEETQARAKIESRLAIEQVSWTCLSCMGQATSGLVGQAALNDLIVLSRPAEGGRDMVPSALMAEVVTGSPTPVLVMPEGKLGFDIESAAAIAWNGSFEAANALRAALPMLRHAKSVTLIAVEEDRKDRFPLTTASEYLSDHGVPSDLVIQPPGAMRIDEELLSAAHRCKADYLVMGAFGHSRAREFWLGGVTRSLLHSAPLPIIFGR